MLPGDVGVEAGPGVWLVLAADGDGLHQTRGELPHLARHVVGEPQRGRGQRLEEEVARGPGPHYSRPD